MKIVSIGGGPAGLYFGLLIKKQRPDAEVVVLERNAPYETFGWGVVFSNETLSNLEAADFESHRDITSAFAHWDAIDIRRHGRVRRSTGHGFAGMGRKKLLNILQRRCEEVGVVLQFDVEVDDVAQLKAGADLIVAADGLNSKTRKAYAEAFAPSLDARKCKYIWLGTEKLFDAFTFLFAETPHGIVSVHAYKFDAHQSTFIVEMTEETYRLSGFDTAPIADSIHALEVMFASHLDGHPLLSNRSSFINFVTVKNASWSHENVVLLGDAAHTAHFSIGSGTKIALEDSIALARAFEGAEPGRAGVAAALARYEQERRPVVERTQKAAQDSLEWFENVKRYWHFDDTAFAVALVTRSKRITYENLRLRDPGLVDDARNGFAEKAFADAREPLPPAPLPPPMFTPLHLRGLRLANRIAVSPMCMYSAREGVVGDFHLVHLGARALGGAGLVMTEMTCIAPEGRITPGCAGLYTPEHVEAWRRIVAFVHGSSSAAIGAQLGHSGRKGSTKLLWEGMDEPLTIGNWPLIAPSPLPYKPGSQVPREMTRADMDEVRDGFVRSTRLAAEAGFDLLELHMAHGYLLASFLSPATNVRTDAYGGSLEARMRFPLEVFEAVRAAWPSERPISVRLSAHDWAPAGRAGTTPTDAVILARALRERGVDIVDVSSGQTIPDEQPAYGRMFQSGFADQIRNEAGVRTMTVGNITTHDQVNSILTAGRADLCLLARPHLDDPNWTLHAATDQGYLAAKWPEPYSTLERGRGRKSPAV